jgi:hypothetical protein
MVLETPPYKVKKIRQFLCAHSLRPWAFYENCKPTSDFFSQHSNGLRDTSLQGYKICQFLCALSKAMGFL